MNKVVHYCMLLIVALFVFSSQATISTISLYFPFGSGVYFVGI